MTSDCDHVKCDSAATRKVKFLKDWTLLDYCDEHFEGLHEFDYLEFDVVEDYREGSR